MSEKRHILDPRDAADDPALVRWCRKVIDCAEGNEDDEPRLRPWNELSDDDHSDKSDFQRWAELFVVHVAAHEIRPRIWGYPCFTHTGTFIVNEIACRRWSEDGTEILFGLDTHNAFVAAPDELVAVVPMLTPGRWVGQAHRADFEQSLREEQRRFNDQLREIVAKAKRTLGSDE